MREADLAVLAAYFLTMIGVGVAYSRQMKSLDLYFAGGKQLPWWMGGVSFVMSYVSALSIVVYAGLGYRYGLVALTIYWTTVPATLAITWLLARRWRRAGIITPVEFLERRFSPVVRQVFAWSGIPLKVIDDGLKIVAIGIFVAAGMHVSALEAMVLVGLVTLAYTLLGGLWATVITDFVQFVLVTTAIVILVPLALLRAGGWRDFLAKAPQGFLHPVGGPYGWPYVGAFLVLSALSLGGNWSLIQKFYSARSDSESRGVGWLASAIFFFLPPVWIVTGMLGRVFIPFHGIDPQTIYARISYDLLPAGMFGLIVAALFAATMSVLSSGYNVTAAVLTVDIHQRWIHPGASQRELVVVGRLFTAVVALVALAIAMLVSVYHWTIFDTMVTVFGFFLPPTVLPVLAGLISRRLSTGGALVGFVAGIGIGLAFLVYKWVAQPANLNAFQAASIVIPAVATALILIAAARWFPARGEAERHAADFFMRLQQPSAPVEKPLASPAPIAGGVIFIMGLALLVIGSGFLGVQANWLSRATGCFFAALGLIMVLAERRKQPS